MLDTLLGKAFGVRLTTLLLFSALVRRHVRSVLEHREIVYIQPDLLGHL